MGELKIVREHSVDQLQRTSGKEEIPESELEMIRGAGGVYSFLGSIGGVPSGFGTASFDRAVSTSPEMPDAKTADSVSADILRSPKKNKKSPSN